MTQVRIPDVSDYQGIVNWSQVLASGRAGGICKATESTSYKAKTFPGNWSTLKALGAVRGAYHFARPGRSAPEAQADYFLAAVGTWQPNDLLILDLEDGTGNLDGFALAFLNRVQAHTGIVPWLYSYGPFVRAHLSSPQLAAYPLWLAAYQSAPPACPPPWKTYQLWQHTDQAQIPGIKGACDESVGDLAVLLPGTPALSTQQPAQVPQTVPTPVYDYEEATTKTMMLHIGKLDGDGNGWADWQPGLGRDPIIVGVVQQGPSPPDDGYWPFQAKVQLSAQPRNGAVRVVVRGGTPGDTVTAWVTVA